MTPFAVNHGLHQFREGETLAEILQAERFPVEQWDSLEVYIGHSRIERDYWHAVRPKRGASLVVKQYALGGDNTILRSVAFIALAAAVTAITGPGGWLGLSGWQAGLASAAAFTVGGLIINALIPPPQEEFDNGDNLSQSLSLTASRNRLEPYGVHPELLGRMRVYPPFAAKPFSEIDGDDRYVTMLYNFGRKPIELRRNALKFGDTQVLDYDEVEIEIDTGGSGDTPDGITLYPDRVDEEIINAKIFSLNQAPPVQRATAADSNWITYSITAPLGLLRVSNNGKNEDNITVIVVVEYRPITGGSWTEHKRHTLKARSAVPLRQSGKIKFATKGQYEVRMWRTDDDRETKRNGGTSDASVLNDDVYFSILRSFQRGNPVRSAANAALVAIRVKQTDQLSGTPDILNAVCTRILPDYKSGLGTWQEDLTQNPASIARHVLTGEANARGADAQLDEGSFILFHEYCANVGFEFNQYIDFNTTVWDTLLSVCASARARPVQVDGLWTIKLDNQQLAPVTLITPRNSWGFSMGRAFPEKIEGLRIRFISERDDLYVNDERIVPAPGFTQDTAQFLEALELPGITNPDLIYKQGLYFLKQIYLRPEIIEFNQDIEHLSLLPLDRFEYQHDAIMVGLDSARIVNLVAAFGIMEIDTLVALATNAQNGYAVQVRNSLGDTQILRLINPEGTITSTLQFNAPDLTIPLENGDFAIVGEYGNISMPLIVKDIIPGADHSAKIIALPYNEGMYTDDPVEPYNPYITLPPGSDVPIIIALVSDESVLERDQAGNLNPIIQGTFGFAGNRVNVNAIRVQFRPVTGDDAGAWVGLSRLEEDAKVFRIRGVRQGLTYELRARYLYNDGSRGAWSEVLQHTVVGKLTPPVNVDNFRVKEDLDGTRIYTFSWNDPETASIDHVGFRIRFQSVDANTLPYIVLQTEAYEELQMEDGSPMESEAPFIEGITPPAWRDMEELRPTGIITESPYESNAPFGGPVEVFWFAIRAVDSAGILSETPVYTTATLGFPRIGNVVAYRDAWEDNWNGDAVRINCHVDPVSGDLVPDDNTVWQATWNDFGDAWASTTVASMRYEDQPFTFTDEGGTPAPRTVTWIHTIETRSTSILTSLECRVDGGTWTAFTEANFPGAQTTGTTVQFAINMIDMSGNIDRVGLQNFITQATEPSGAAAAGVFINQ